MIKLVVALGNVGNKYSQTRHNLGWLALDQLSFFSQLIWKEKFNGVFTSHNIKGEKIYFLKPHTYMNLSGRSVRELCKFFKIDITEVLVVHDEVDIEYGRIMFKKGGGVAGHNGLRSVMEEMSSKDFLRLRLGIGKPAFGEISSYVLSNFSNEEFNSLPKYLKGSAEAIEASLFQGFEKASSKFSKKTFV